MDLAMGARRRFDGGDVETLVRGTLGRLLFSGDDVKKSVKIISGGEQGRMLFGKLMLLRRNVLLLDETDQSPGYGIDRIAEYRGREKFPGTVIFVSHDREFVSSLATRIIDMKTDHSIIDYRGSYEEYLNSQGIE
jgi:ATPase subunit of ABC transporter with duplicated ATPase domains